MKVTALERAKADDGRDPPSILAIASVYLGAMMQGLALVSFAASGPTLRSAQHLSNAQYGLIFLPQVVATIAGALVGASFAPRLGMQRLLWIALLFDALSQLGLGCVPQVSVNLALPLVLASTTAMGIGFGLMGSPMNGCPVIFFPNNTGAATVGIHCFNGSGLIAGPILLQLALTHFDFTAYPLTQAALALCLAVLTVLAPFNLRSESRKIDSSSQVHPARVGIFWVLAAIAIVYSFAEGTFGNWAAVYLQDDRHLSRHIGALGLSVFWGGVVAGRLMVSFLIIKFPERLVWRILPLIMILAFLLLPEVRTAESGIALFMLAGFGCSAFFPLTVTLVTRRFQKHLAWVSAMMIAALMTGNGLGSFLLGTLHAHLSFENLYRASALYPVIALLLTFAVPDETKQPGIAS
jgi:predicted MFS family arabinose efflux permease